MLAIGDCNGVSFVSYFSVLIIVLGFVVLLGWPGFCGAILCFCCLYLLEFAGCLLLLFTVLLGLLIDCVVMGIYLTLGVKFGCCLLVVFIFNSVVVGLLGI